MSIQLSGTEGGEKWQTRKRHCESCLYLRAQAWISPSWASRGYHVLCLASECPSGVACAQVHRWRRVAEKVNQLFEFFFAGHSIALFLQYSYNMTVYAPQASLLIKVYQSCKFLTGLADVWCVCFPNLLLSAMPIYRTYTSTELLWPGTGDEHCSASGPVAKEPWLWVCLWMFGEGMDKKKSY